jgi:dTDP-4-amino-4,6-dideoxygalactose transaminase
MNVPFLDLQAQFATIREEALAEIQTVLGKCNFILGEPVDRFEKSFAEFCECTRAVGVASGLDAIKLALRALKIGPGDEVITAANTFIATALAISAVGAKPVLVDCDPATYNIDVSKIEAAVTPRTRAIMPVHLYGQPADMDPIMDIAGRRRLHVVEDASQAHGARYKGRRVGSFGILSAFSLYPGKNLGATGDAGIITTRDPALAKQLTVLRNYGSEVKYYHSMLGENSRLDTMHAAVLCVKLERLDQWNAARRKWAALYTELLKGVKSVTTPTILPSAESVFHLYVVRVPRRNELMAFLKERGIGTIIHYPVPLHLQEAYAGAGWKKGDFPVSEKYADEIVSLPMFAELTEPQVRHVAQAVREFSG